MELSVTSDGDIRDENLSANWVQDASVHRYHYHDSETGHDWFFYGQSREDADSQFKEFTGLDPSKTFVERVNW